MSSPPVRAKPRRSQNGIAAGKLLLGTIAKAPMRGISDIHLSFDYCSLISLKVIGSRGACKSEHCSKLDAKLKTSANAGWPKKINGVQRSKHMTETG
jgi:hypothetical protein